MEMLLLVICLWVSGIFDLCKTQPQTTWRTYQNRIAGAASANRSQQTWPVQPAAPYEESYTSAFPGVLTHDGEDDFQDEFPILCDVKENKLFNKGGNYSCLE